MDPNAGRWNAEDVVYWAQSVRLSEDAIRALSDNEVDGATLITLKKEELQSELDIRSLPARRYLWDLIERLRNEQEVLDHSAAIDTLSEEVEKLRFSQGPDDSGGVNRTDPAVIQTLLSDAAKERQIIEDRLLAFRLQGTGGYHDRQSYEDSEFARSEQVRLDQLHLQSELDRRVAISLAPANERPAQATNNRNNTDNEVRSLFGLCMDVCSTNRVNVADGLINRAISVASQLPMDELTLDDRSGESEAKVEDEDSTIDLDRLPLINRCDVCFVESRRGFLLPCSHPYCVDCMKAYLGRALRDMSLLPLQCCEIEIDVQVATLLMDKKDAKLLLARTAELQATNKMYCPACNCFINLNLVDTSESTELECECGARICTSCRTAEHPHLTCAANKAAQEGSDEPLFELAKEQGWKQCPRCSIMINLALGCNHMTCASCNHEFCFLCLQDWQRNGGTCTSGRCELWDEERLLAAGEARVQAQEEANQARNRAFIAPVNPAIRRIQVEREMAALRHNEYCQHEWVRRNLRGSCERCGYDLLVYGMVCRSQCRATVCHTCANHRIPSRGWR